MYEYIYIYAYTFVYTKHCVKVRIYMMSLRLKCIVYMTEFILALLFAPCSWRINDIALCLHYSYYSYCSRSSVLFTPHSRWNETKRVGHQNWTQTRPTTHTHSSALSFVKSSERAEWLTCCFPFFIGWKESEWLVCWWYSSSLHWCGVAISLQNTTNCISANKCQLD